MGYADGADFTWDSPWSLAEDCGIRLKLWTGITFFGLMPLL